MPQLLISSKVLAQTLVAVAAAVVVIIHDLQSQGVELPSWVVAALPVVSLIVGYFKAENNPAPSAIAAAKNL